MPGFTTHYLFGLNTYRALEHTSLKKILREDHAAYSLGLQGPDLFFYFLPSYLIHKNNIGSVAHIEKTNEFLYYLLESRKLFPDKKEKKIAESYIAGFIGHYILDTHCHPYVYWKTNFEEKNNHYYGNHMSLEVDIDTELLQLYKHRLPSQFHQASTIVLTRLQLRTIAAILYYVYAKTYPELKVCYTTMRTSIRSMQMGIRFLHDPSGKKKVIMRKTEQIFLGYPLFSPMIPSDNLVFHLDPLNILNAKWHNPWDKALVSTDSFLDLLEGSQRDYSQLLNHLSQLFCTKPHSPLEKKRTQKLLDTLGNNSYHSGLDSCIPS